MDRQTELLIHQYLKKLNIVPGKQKYTIEQLASFQDSMSSLAAKHGATKKLKVPKKAAIIMFLESIDVPTNENLVKSVKQYISSSQNQDEENENPQVPNFARKSKRMSRNRIPLSSIKSMPKRVETQDSYQSKHRMMDSEDRFAQVYQSFETSSYQPEFEDEYDEQYVSDNEHFNKLYNEGYDEEYTSENEGYISENEHYNEHYHKQENEEEASDTETENNRYEIHKREKNPKVQRSYNTMMMSAQFRLDETKKIEEAARARRLAIEREIEQVEAQRRETLRKQIEEEELAKKEEERAYKAREALDKVVTASITSSQELLDGYQGSPYLPDEEEIQRPTSKDRIRISNKLQAARQSRKKQLYLSQESIQSEGKKIEKDTLESIEMQGDEDQKLSIQRITRKKKDDQAATNLVTQEETLMKDAVDIEEEEKKEQIKKPNFSKTTQIKSKPPVVGGIASMMATMNRPKLNRKGSLSLLKAKRKQEKQNKQKSEHAMKSATLKNQEPPQKKQINTKHPKKSLTLKERIAERRKEMKQQPQPEVENYVVEKKKRPSSVSSTNSSNSQKSRRMLTMRRVDGSLDISASPLDRENDNTFDISPPTAISVLSSLEVSPTEIPQRKFNRSSRKSFQKSSQKVTTKTPNETPSFEPTTITDPSQAFWEKDVDSGVTLFGQVTANANTIQKKQNAIPNEDVTPPSEISLIQCKTCSRKFNEKAYTKHAKICDKVFCQKRPAFTVEKVTEEAKQMQMPSLKQQNKTQQVKANTLSHPPTQEKVESDGRIVCVHCHRRFSPKIHESHVIKCKDIRAKPTRLKRRRESSLMR